MQVDRRGDRGSPLESGIVTAATSWVEAASARQGENYLSCLALRTAIAKPVNIVLCGHLAMAPLAAAIASVRAPLWVQVFGIEAWEELSWLHRQSIEAASLVTSVSRYTRRRLLAWVNIDPARVRVLPILSMAGSKRRLNPTSYWTNTVCEISRCYSPYLVSRVQNDTRAMIG